MSWKSYYQEHLLNADALMDKLPKEDITCTMPSGPAEPRVICRAFYDHRERFRNVRLISMMMLGEMVYCRPEMAGHFRFISTFNGADSRKHVAAKTADFVPVYFHQMPRYIREFAKPDVAILHVSAPDEHGWCSFGTNVDYQEAAVESARIVIAQINRQMPRSLGQTQVHITNIDWFIEVDEEIPGIPAPKIGEVEKAIGANCASLIRDRDCLQLGIGAIPDAVLKQLTDKRDLGIHSEMLTDSVCGLMDAGIITNRYKQLDKYASTATFAMGTPDLYRFLDNNPGVNLLPVDYTNEPRIIARQDNMVTVNSALQVDLLGQVAADTIGKMQYSGVGGQVDFVRGANMSRNGRNIIALPSTAKQGTVSRISLTLPEYGAVTTGRFDVDYVVTEYGIARLFGKNVVERAEALIAIAHPNFRDELKKQFQAI